MHDKISRQFEKKKIWIVWLYQELNSIKWAEDKNDSKSDILVFTREYNLSIWLPASISCHHEQLTIMRTAYAQLVVLFSSRWQLPTLVSPPKSSLNLAEKTRMLAKNFLGHHGGMNRAWNGPPQNPLKSRGVRGHAPPEIFLNSSIKKRSLVHSELYNKGFKHL